MIKGYLPMYLFDTSPMDKQEPHTPTDTTTAVETLRNYAMVGLTLVFVFLYAAAFSGKLDPLKDNSMLLRFEPVIFLLIGFYFGGLPERRSQRTFKEEVARQTQKADAAQYVKEKVQQEREMLEEKIRNAKTAFKTIEQSGAAAGRQSNLEAIAAALRILDS